MTQHEQQLAAGWLHVSQRKACASPSLLELAGDQIREKIGGGQLDVADVAVMLHLVLIISPS